MEEINEAFDLSSSVSVYNDGNKVNYLAGSQEYKTILTCWNDMVEGAHPMPAFGVSINDMTLKEMQSGLWVEFEYDKVYECCGLPFEKLLVKVEKDFYGFNLIRYTNEYEYFGRCFYLDLVNKNMDNLYELLLNL